MLRKSLRKGHIFYTDPKRLRLDTIILPSTLFGWKICYIGKEHLVSVASKDQLGYGYIALVLHVYYDSNVSSKNNGYSY